MEEQKQHAQTLVDEILKDAETKAQRIRKKAEREATRVTKKGDAEAEKAAADVIAQAETEAEQARTQKMASVPIEVRRIELEAREATLRGVLDEARSRLENLEGDDRRRLLADLVVEAALAIDGDMMTVAVGPDDAPHVTCGSIVDDVRRRIAEATGREVSLSARVDETMSDGGVVVTRGDGRQMVDNTFGARAERLEDAAREAAYAQLFNDGAGDKSTAPHQD